MPVCSVYGCTQKDRKNFTTFHRFPRDEVMRKKWIQATQRKDFNPSPTSVLCSNHFTEEDFERTSPYYVRIKEGAIPTVFECFPWYKQEKVTETQKALAEHEDHNVCADMDEPSNVNTIVVKEEITVKEEVHEENDAFIDSGTFSVPTLIVDVKKENKSSEETETATEGGTPIYSSEEDWAEHPAEQVLQSKDVNQKTSSADPEEAERPVKRFRSLEESSDRLEERCHEIDTSNPLALLENAEMILKKDIQLKKEEIEMRKKVLETMQNDKPGDESVDKEYSHSSINELLKSDLHIAIEELELMLQNRTFLYNSKRINHLELKLKDEEMKMREEEHKMKLKLNEIKKAYMFESSHNGSLV